MRALPTAVLATALFALAACAQGGGSGPGDDNVQSAFETRAQQVADAWENTASTGAWLSGFVPLQELTVAPVAGFPTDEAKQAFSAGWYVLGTDLPATRPADGTVTFSDGSTLGVSLSSAKEAYAAMDQGDPPPCPNGPPPPAPSPTGPDGSVSSPANTACEPLVVVGARLGQTTIRTSRGEATVPAWQFTIQGSRDRIARVAVAPASISPVPQVTLGGFEGHRYGLKTAQNLVRVDGDQVTYHLGVGACDKNIRPLFVETDELVLVSGRADEATGTCIDLLKLEPVTITLSEPVGNRVVVDALNGTPLLITVR